ncbi:M20 family metallopeptidase [Singulisphaera sp. PoT]|uniref:M20 family metallopeptidase n=1 Tax=Singulisphaera sp. PoT TaxID=3411797 RepID=UPI003BF53DD0
MDAVIRLLSDLVAIPSVNPMGRPLSGPGVLEAGMSDYLENWFRDLGVSVERQTAAPGRDNLIARYEAPHSRTTILFDAHQDTVPTDGMTIPPFEPEIRDGKLYGRGSCDVKGGMSAMLTAFARLVKERPIDSASVIMACTVDEEFTHVGSSRLAKSSHGADLAIVAEPTKLDLVDRHKGAVRWKIKTNGVACHSSTPQLGVNAIYKMGPVLSALSEYASRLHASKPDPVLGSPTLSVGRIEGGVSVNVVPDWCAVEIDRRLIPGEEANWARDDVAKFLQDRLGSLEGIDFLPPWVRMPPLSPRDSRATEWVEPIRHAVGKAIGHVPSVGGVPYGTDGGPLGEDGLPCFVFGPGDIAQAHTKDEWIEIEQVKMAAEAYYAMACGLGNR